jgi:hypothetical protein
LNREKFNEIKGIVLLIQILDGFKNILGSGLFSLDGLSNMGSLFLANPISATFSRLVLLLMVVLLGFLLWLTIVSQVALVNNSAAIISKKKKENKEKMNQ